MTTPTEQLYTVNQVAEILRVSPNRAINLFAGEPGVINLGTNMSTKKARKLRQLRIPASVLGRVIARRTVQ
jgi:hypothetical protein